MPSPAARSIGYLAAGLLPWAGWYAAIRAFTAAVAAGKDPADYTGTCVRASGQVVPCSLEQWLVWDASPMVDVLALAGGLAAATISGYVYLRYRRMQRRSELGLPPTL